MARKKIDEIQKRGKVEQVSLAESPGIDEKTKEILSGETQGRGTMTPNARANKAMEKINKTIATAQIQNSGKVDEGFNVSTSLNAEKSKKEEKKKKTTTKKSTTKSTKAKSTTKKKTEEVPEPIKPYDGEVPEPIDPGDKFEIDELTGEVIGKKSDTKKLQKDVKKMAELMDDEPLVEEDNPLGGIDTKEVKKTVDKIQKEEKPKKKTTSKRKKITTKPSAEIVVDEKKLEEEKTKEEPKEEKPVVPVKTEEEKEKERLEAIAKLRGDNIKERNRRKASRLHRQKLSVMDRFLLLIGGLVTAIGGVLLLNGLYYVLWLGDEFNLFWPAIITAAGVLILYKAIKIKDKEEQKWDE